MQNIHRNSIKNQFSLDIYVYAEDIVSSVLLSLI